MLGDAPVASTIPVADIERARRFYSDVLGLKPGEAAEAGSEFYSGDTRLILYPTPSAGKAAHTLASWNVPNLNRTMDELRGRGVRFEEYDMPGLKTTNGVAEMGGMRGAWFKDSEGNILAVTEGTIS